LNVCPRSLFSQTKKPASFPRKRESIAARLRGTRFVTITQIETRKHKGTVKACKAIAKALGVNLDNVVE
jgi:hypothetical protein